RLQQWRRRGGGRCGSSRVLPASFCCRSLLCRCRGDQAVQLLTQIRFFDSHLFGSALKNRSRITSTEPIPGMLTTREVSAPFPTLRGEVRQNLEVSIRSSPGATFANRLAQSPP